MAKKPMRGSPVVCHSCRAPFPTYHPDDEGFIDCVTCGRVPVTGRAFLAGARAKLEAVTRAQAEATAATMEAEALAAREQLRAEAEIRARRERQERILSEA